MRATIAFTLLRLILFAAVFGILYAFGARSYLLVALAILVSGALSYFVLYRQRTAMSDVLSRRITNFRERLDAGTRAEDDD